MAPSLLCCFALIQGRKFSRGMLKSLCQHIEKTSANVSGSRCPKDSGHSPETLFSDVFNTSKQLMCIPQDITAAPFCVGGRGRGHIKIKKLLKGTRFILKCLRAVYQVLRSYLKDSYWWGNSEPFGLQGVRGIFPVRSIKASELPWPNKSKISHQ